VSETPADRNRRILVIDDNRKIHDDFRKILHRPAAQSEALTQAEAVLFEQATPRRATIEYEIDSATQGQEGLALVQQSLRAGRPYAMAFVDIRMPPGWDGVETVQRIWEVDPDLQVVICTAFSDCSWDEMIEAIGQTDRLLILKKPFDAVEAAQLAHTLTEKWSLLQQTKGMLATLEERVQQRTHELTVEIEERRLAEEKVLIQTKAMAAAANGIVITSRDGTMIWVNPAFTTLTGYSAEEAIGQNLRLLESGQHPADFYRHLWDTVLAGKIWRGEMVNRRKDGSHYTEEMTITPVRDAAGEIARFIAIKQDVTERKQAEQTRATLEIQLRQAQKLEAIGHLAAGIAHEINTPTQYIGDNLHFVQDAIRDVSPVLEQHRRLLEAAKQNAITEQLIGELEATVAAVDLEYLLAEVPKALEQSLDGVRRVAKIVQAMKEFSHPGSDQKTAVDLNRAIESTITVARNEWKYVADVVTDFDPDLPRVPCLPGEFNQVILNLLINATHAIADVVKTGQKEKGTITISTRPVDSSVEVRIRDTGPGIPETVRSRIFDPFFTTKPVGKGTGQGLAIARSVIVDKHGGSIDFETETNNGTTFIIRLPLAGQAAAEKEYTDEEAHLVCR
jgi:two-component system, NtrC family, sensor kinase